MISQSVLLVIGHSPRSYEIEVQSHRMTRAGTPSIGELYGKVETLRAVGASEVRGH